MTELSECLVGTGYVLEGSQEICRANYHITTLLDPSAVAMIENPVKRDLLKEIRGRIQPLGISLSSLFGKDWTLALEDGKKIDFFIAETVTGRITPITQLR